MCQTKHGYYIHYKIMRRKKQQYTISRNLIAIHL